MKPIRLIPFFIFAVLGGCSPHGDPNPGPSATLTSQQNLQRIQNDPKIPDGLKQIQTETLQHQAGMKN